MTSSGGHEKIKGVDTTMDVEQINTIIRPVSSLDGADSRDRPFMAAWTGNKTYRRAGLGADLGRERISRERHNERVAWLEVTPDCILARDITAAATKAGAVTELEIPEDRFSELSLQLLRCKEKVAEPPTSEGRTLLLQEQSGVLELADDAWVLADQQLSNDVEWVDATYWVQWPAGGKDAAGYLLRVYGPAETDDDTDTDDEPAVSGLTLEISRLVL